MTRQAQEVVIVGLTRRLNENGSWSGETHVQKSAYVLSELGNVPFSFRFILYKHGPFSFALRDELTSMRADGLLERQPQAAPYGPRFFVTEGGRELEKRHKTVMKPFRSKLDWLSRKLAKKNVHELERLATALWITRRTSEPTAESRARRLKEIKPHVTREEALESVREVEELIAKANAITA